MKKDFQTIGIIAKHNIGERAEILKTILKEVKNYTDDILLCENCGPVMGSGAGMDKTEILQKADLAIILGGDGTLLKTARLLPKNKTVRILGVHMGTKGFLTECLPNRLPQALRDIFDGNYCDDNRSLLRVTVYRNNKKYYTSLALNEVVVNQGGFARLIHLRVEVNKRKLSTYIADGLIISTPTGSTGHALAAYGPIIHPKLECVLLTAICPLNLNARPIVIPNNRQFLVKIETEWREQKKPIVLTVDGQETINLKLGDVIRIRKSSRTFTMIRLKGHNYYRMLRQKLGWSVN